MNCLSICEQMKFDLIMIYYKEKIKLIFKRVFDIVISLIMIILCSPILLIISILIVKDSKGGVFYRQERVTQYGRVFRIFKFRTMVQNADQIGTQVTVSNDSRITKIGSKLRDCRLDELPQLFNIFLGDMTFVGTRPESVHYVKSYTNEMYATLLLPAGVTSEASIEYKDEADLLDQADDVDSVYINEVLPEKMKYNLNSIKKFSFFKEIATMFRTVFAVVR